MWQEKCGEQGSCWIYDSTKLGMSFFILTASASAISVPLLMLAHRQYRAPETLREKCHNQDSLPNKFADVANT